MSGWIRSIFLGFTDTEMTIDTMTLNTSGGKTFRYFDIASLGVKAEHLPFSLRVLLENLIRTDNGTGSNAMSISALAKWNPNEKSQDEIWFTPARVLLQDFTGVPCIADLAAMRDAVSAKGGDPKRVNPLQPVDLVIDHSVQVDAFGDSKALDANMKQEFERNRERYEFLRWGQQAFSNFRVVPPGSGIIHQVNVEHLAQVVMTGQDGTVYFDTLVGTDSHTPMVNSLGVLGWGVGGIEAEAAMLGQPISMLIPQVIGVRLSGKLPAGCTATDLVLTLVQKLRQVGVVGKFVEFFGPGLDEISVTDRAVVSNMTPEHGATCGFFPVDRHTIEYLLLTGRSKEQAELVEAYCRAQGTWREAGSDKNAHGIEYSQVIDFDFSTVVPSLSGPRRPQDRVALSDMKTQWKKSKTEVFGITEKTENAVGAVKNSSGEPVATISHGAVVIAAITSCTNTAAPSLMLGAGLLAKKAVERGLTVKPWVKTSLSPGSHAVTDYLNSAGLMPYLEALGFYNVGYGCTTCIGNSGPLPAPVAKAIEDGKLVACSVLSGNRNFEGRVNPLCKANWLAAPPLVIAYAIAGTIDFDPMTEPLGTDKDGKPVFLADIWPAADELDALVRSTVEAGMFAKAYANVFEGTEDWKQLPAPTGDLFNWNPNSTYVKAPPFFDACEPKPVSKAYCLAVLGDSVTTDHISPAGNIAAGCPAALYLQQHEVERKDFNSYGSRRGNHEVMMRGTFANIRLRNQMVPGVEGGQTVYVPTGEQMTIYDASVRYRESGHQLVIVAGKEYGSGSSRDWAAKGPNLLGVNAVLAESYERIHRSNLVGMGILPLQFENGDTPAKLGLTGKETFTIILPENGLVPGCTVKVTAELEEKTLSFTMRARIDTPNEILYYRNGGILPYMMRQMLG